MWKGSGAGWKRGRTSAGLVSGKRFGHPRPKARVGIVTVHAPHGFLRQSVLIRALELRPNLEMAARTLLVDFGGLTNHKSVRPSAVNLVARCTCVRPHLAVTALQASNVGGLVQMASEGNVIRGCTGQLRLVADGGAVRAVAGLAGMSGRTTLLVLSTRWCGPFCEGARNLFVAGHARFRSGVREARCAPTGCAARVRPINRSAASVLRMHLVHIDYGARLMTHRAALAER